MTKEIEPRKLAAFLSDLSAVSNKHNLSIWGCGCCDSPTIETGDGTPGRYVMQGRLVFEDAPAPTITGKHVEHPGNGARLTTLGQPVEEGEGDE
jgi:hypothetical protein